MFAMKRARESATTSNANFSNHCASGRLKQYQRCTSTRDRLGRDGSLTIHRTEVRIGFVTSKSNQRSKHTAPPHFSAQRKSKNLFRRNPFSEINFCESLLVRNLFDPPGAYSSLARQTALFNARDKPRFTPARPHSPPTRRSRSGLFGFYWGFQAIPLYWVVVTGVVASFVSVPLV